MKIIEKAKQRPHLTAILIILALGLIAYSPFITTNCLNVGDVANEYVAFFYYQQESMFTHQETPLWIHEISSGTPFFAVGDKPVLYPITIITLLAFDYGVAFNANALIHLLLAGIGMYLLAFYFIRNPWYALISGIVYMLNFHMFRKMLKFWGVSWIPWVILAYLLAFEHKDRFIQAGYGILAALGLAFQFHVGSIEIALYTLLIVFLMSVFRLFSKDWKERAKTMIFVGIVSGLFFTGFIAIKFLPNFEFGELTSRAQGISLEQAKGSHYEWLNFEFLDTYEKFTYAPKSLVFNLTKGCQEGGCSSIGLIATILLLASLWFWKKKTVFFYWLLLLLALFLVTGSFVFEFFYHYVPGFDKLQHAARLGIIYIFAASVLVAYGAKQLAEWATKKYKLKDKQKALLLILVVVLMFVDMVFIVGFAEVFNEYNWGECKEYEKTPIMTHLATKYDAQYPFRIKVFESMGRGGVAQYLTIPLGLDIIDGQYGGLWIPEYINQYLTIARQAPVRLWGNLNGKYVTMTEKRNISGLKYLDEFTPCPKCVQPEAAGPYLYENTQVVPRAFWTNQSILLVGTKENTAQVSYALLTAPQYNLSNQILSLGEHAQVGKYKLDELKQHKAIILTQGAVDSTFVLEKYAEQGGIIVPNVLEGQDTITNQDIERLLTLSNTSDFKQLPITKTPNSITLPLKDLRPGFVVMNEKMHLFPGWKVRVDGKEIINGESERLKPTNILLGRFFLDAPANQVVYSYEPRSYYLGKKVTTFTLIATLLFLAVLLWRRKSSKSQ